VSDIKEDLPSELTVFLRRNGTLALVMPLEEAILGGANYIREDLINKQGACRDCHHFNRSDPFGIVECIGVHPVGMMSCVKFKPGKYFKD